MQQKMLTGKDFAEHNNKSSRWIILHEKAYDVTEFLSKHPGGPIIILKYASKDAKEGFEPIHPPDILDEVLTYSPPPQLIVISLY